MMSFESLCLRDRTLKWFESYFKERKQYVTVNDESSSLQTIILGVLQGSILGPLLFLIYMNDINFCSDEFEFLCFADDTTATLTICFENKKNKTHKTCNNYSITTSETINHELQKLFHWLSINKLSFNISKTKYMIFHNPQRNLKKFEKYSFLVQEPSTIIMNELPINRVKTHMFLGFKIDENLNWNHHVNHISNKISKTIGVLNVTKSFLPKYILKTLYNSLIMPYLQYGILLWGYKCVRLESLQKKCIRLISNSFYLEHTEKLFKLHNTLKISDIFKLKCLLFYYKFRNSSLPYYLNNCFTFYTPNNRYNLRETRSKILNEYSCFNKNSENCLRYYLPKFINNLDVNLKLLLDTRNITSLKMKIKQEILSKYSDAKCNLKKCYPCNQKLFYPKHLSIIMSFINIYAYIDQLYFNN